MHSVTQFLGERQQNVSAVRREYFQRDWLQQVATLMNLTDVIVRELDTSAMPHVTIDRILSTP